MKINFPSCLAAVASTMIATSGLAADSAPGTVLAAYTVLSPDASGETVAVARTILQGVDSRCPSLVFPDGSGSPVGTEARKNPDPGNFPVTVCEAPVRGRMSVSGSDLSVPGPPGEAKSVILVGDSGCKPSRQDGCRLGSEAWPFQQISRSAASAKPDLVLHMGDYNYRGTPGKITIDGEKRRVYDAGDNTDSERCKLSGPYYGQNSKGSVDPDTWENWRLDLFEPAVELLAAAPWVVARGNHELCSRAGPGWFYLLDPGSDHSGVGTGQNACGAAESSAPLIFDQPYRVDVSGLSVVVLDSANACDQGSLHQGHYDRQFNRIQVLVGLAPKESLVTLMSHRPLWAVKKADDTTAPGDTDPSGKYAIIDQTLQGAYLKFPLPRPVDLVVSGHMHRFQTIGFARDSKTPYPEQLVVGNSGVALAGNHPKKPFSFPVGRLTGTGFGLSEFGYMEIEPSKKHGWKGKLRDISGKTLASCEGGKGWKKTGPCKPKD